MKNTDIIFYFSKIRISISNFNNKMTDALSTIDRFFHIITSSEDRNNERILQEWSYLYTLLKSEPVYYDRIDAYLNILENHDSNTKRNLNKGKRSLTEHPKAKELFVAAEEIGQMLDLGSAKLKIYDNKYE